MSGTFMDGGGNDHSGHAMHSGGGDSFHDGGLHDGGVHDHHGHDHGTNSGNGLDCVNNGNDFTHHGHQGGGGFLANLFGLNQQHQHSFLAHLLGLDHDAHVSHGGELGHMDGGAAGHAPIALIPFWAVALQGITVSSMFQGMRLTPAGWMLCLFLTYISWLCVVYWVRHHEPLANAVIGTHQQHSVDHRMLAGSRNFVPPQSAPAESPFGRPAISLDAPTAGSANAAALTGRSIPIHLGAPVAQPIMMPAVPATVAPTATTIPVPQPSVMQVPVYEPTGARVKTIVNR